MAKNLKPCNFIVTRGGKDISLSYPEMVEYLASHPELMEEGKAERRKIGGGAKKAKGKEADPILEALEKGKIKGVAGMNTVVWNAAIDTIKAAYIAGKSLAEAINEGIAYLKKKGEDVSKYQDAFDDIRKAEKPRVATFFSGAGTMEAALPDSESVMAVEYSPTYMKAYNDAFGTKYEARDVTQIDPEEVKAANPDIFHASPVCKNFSKAKSFNTVRKQDMDSAESVARVIREAQPPIVTIENVPDYQKYAPFNVIIQALKDAGYTYDVGVYNAADYGGVQNRRRLLVRAVKDGKLPALPEKQKPGDWYKALKDLIDDAPNTKFIPKTKEEHWEVERINKMIEDGRLDASKPILTMGASAFKDQAAAANSGGPSYTLLSSSNAVPRIIMPDGRVKRVTPEMMKRLMDLPLSYPVPADAKVAKEVLGNGMDGAFTKALIEPLIKPVKAEDRVEKFLKDLYWKEGGLGMNAGLWNAAVTTMLKAYKAGKTVYEAIQAGVEYLKEKGENIKDYESVIDKATEFLKAKAKSDGREIGTPPSEAKPEPRKPKATPPPARPTTPTATEEREVRERKTITSIKEATDISDQVKEALGGERTRYEVLPNTVSVAEANAILNAVGAEKAKEMVLTANRQMPSAFRTTLAQVLIKQYNKEGKFRDAVDVAEGIAEIATDWGQGIQALSLFEFLTFEGQLLAAQREVDRQKNKRFQAEGEKIKKIRKAFKKADDEAIEGAIQSVVTDTDKTTAPTATRKSGWGEKNKIVTKAIYEAAKKALKKFAFTGVPPELVTIAAYHIEAGARSFADFSKEMVKDFGRKVKPYLKAAYKAAQKKVGGSGYSTDAEIATHMAADIEKDIRQVMKESGVKIRELIKQHYSEAERTKEALTKALVDKLGLDPADAALIAEKVNKEYNRIATDKKQKALDAIERRLLRKSPVRKKAEEKLIELSNLGAFDEGKFKEDYAKAMGFPELTEKDAATIKELAEKVQQAPEGRPKQKAIVDLLNYQANIKEMSEFEVGTAIWMASILSGPVTQAKNIFGNVFNMSTLLFDMAITNPKDLPFILKGLTGGLGTGFAEGGTTLITGYPPMKLRNEAMGILERTHYNKYSPYQSLKYVTRFMLASDALTYGGLREMRAYQKALAEARENYPSVNAVQKAIEILGKTDAQIKNAKDIARQEYNEEIARIEADTTLSKAQRVAKKQAATFERYRRVYDLVEQSRPDFLVTDSHEYAAKGTFTNPPTGTLGVGARFLNGVKHNIPISSFAIPFTNTIANVANNTINYTPLGYARALRGGSILMGRQKEFTDEDRARMVRNATLGMAAATAAYILSSFGGDDEDEEKNWFRITAEGYGDYKKNKELEATGWKPYSIKIGNTWYSYQLTPLMGILSAVGAIRDYEKYHKKKLGESDMNKIVLPMQMMLSTIAESSYLSSVDGFLSAILDASRGDQGQKLVDWITKMVTPFAPLVGTNFYQQNAQMITRMLEIPDKEFRGTYFGKMLRNVPYARDQYFNVVNGLGEEILPPRVNVLYSKPEGGKYDKLWQLLSEKNQVTGRPERRGASYIDINGEQKAMNDEQFYLFAKTRGEYIRNLMLANYDNIKEMDEDEFAKWMQGVRSGANRWANDKLALQYEKGIYEENIQPYTAEASHEKDRIMYAIEIGDADEAKSAFENYDNLSPKGAGKDKKELFVEIVDDKIAPTGIKPADRIDFYKAVMLGANPNIKIQQIQDNGKVKMVNKPFSEIFTEEERQSYKSQYIEQEKIVSKKLKVLDEALNKNYSSISGEEAIWRRYVQRMNKQ